MFFLDFVGFGAILGRCGKWWKKLESGVLLERGLEPPLGPATTGKRPFVRKVGGARLFKEIYRVECPT